MTEVTVTDDQVRAFADLFRGFPGRFGRFVITGRDPERGKTKGVARTEDRPPSIDDFRAHLEGKERVGIIPLREDNTVGFAALDIDKYNDELRIEDFTKRIRELPLICTSSKSGGIHAWLFMDPPLPAAQVIQAMKHWAGQLGHSRCEVFPKQAGRANSADIGNWINLPYFGDTCKAVLWNKDGTEIRQLTLDEFLAVAKNTNPGMDFLADGALKVTSRDRGSSVYDFMDGPPCLQTILRRVADNEIDLTGTRNNFMFNVMTYLKRKYDESQAKAVAMTINSGGFTLVIDHSKTRKTDPIEEIKIPKIDLPESELLKTALRKTDKEYGYQCNQFPLSEFCQKSVCKRRKYGIGSDSRGDFDVTIENFVKYETRPPKYFCDVAGKRVIIPSAEDLFKFSRFKAHVMNAATVFIPDMSQKQWDDFLGKRLDNISVVEPPYEGSAVVNALYQYVWERKAKTKEEILREQKVYYNEKLRVYEFMPDGFKAWAEKHGGIKNYDNLAVREELQRELDLKLDGTIQKRIGPRSTIRVWQIPYDSLIKPERQVIEVEEEHPF